MKESWTPYFKFLKAFEDNGGEILLAAAWLEDEFQNLNKRMAYKILDYYIANKNAIKSFLLKEK